MGKIISIAGGGGLLGSYIAAEARRRNYHTRILTRAPGHKGEQKQEGMALYSWDPHGVASGSKKDLEQLMRALADTYILVNLAGASIAAGRLNHAHKKRVLRSRLEATLALGAASAFLQRAPRVWMQASATGFYGNGGEGEMEESAPPGKLFLSDVCQQWEEQAREACVQIPETRLILMRIGMVLAKNAPAWKKMSLPICWGVGGPLGHGMQWYSWIDAEDLSRAIFHLAEDSSGQGAFNFTTPEPIRQSELVARAAALIQRPSIFPAPAFLLRLALGGVADELVLSSCKALPKRLLESGFHFKRGSIEQELGYLLE